MYRITYEHLDDEGTVTDKQVWNVSKEGSVHINESRPVHFGYSIGTEVPESIYKGPHMLQLTVTLDPSVKMERIKYG